MALYTLRPTAEISRTQVNLVGAANSAAAESDNSDSTWSQHVAGFSQVVLELSNLPTLGATETIARVRVRLRYTTLNGTTDLYTIIGDPTTGESQVFDYYTANLTNAPITTYSGAYKTTAPNGAPWTATRINASRLTIQDNDAGTSKPRVLESYVDVETNLRPTTTLTAPADNGTIADDTRPTVSANYADAENDPLDAFEVRVFDSATYNAGGFDPETAIPVYSSGVVTATGTSWSHRLPTPLANGTYKVFARSRQGGSIISQWSLFVSRTFTLNVVPPNPPTMTLAPRVSEAAVRISLTDNGPAFSTGTRYFEIERSIDGGQTYTRLTRTFSTNVPPLSTPTDSSGYTSSASIATTFVDYEAPRGMVLTYRARVRHDFSSGAVTVSGYTTGTTTLEAKGWHLKSLTSPAHSIKPNVHSSEWTLKSQENLGVFYPLGRTGPVVISDSIGLEQGQLTLAFLSHDAFLAFEALRARREVLLLQSPYHDHRFIRLGADRSRSITLGFKESKPIVTISFFEVEA